MEMLEEQQREEMELAALQEEQEYEQVRQQQHMPNWISESMPKLCYLDLGNSGKAVSSYLLCSVRIKLLGQPVA